MLPKHPPGPRRCFFGGGACWYCICSSSAMSSKGERVKCCLRTGGGPP